MALNVGIEQLGNRLGGLVKLCSKIVEQLLLLWSQNLAEKLPPVSLLSGNNAIGKHRHGSTKDAGGCRCADHVQSTKCIRCKFACVIEKELVQTAVVCLHIKPGKSEGGALAEGQGLKTARLDSLEDSVDPSFRLRLSHSVRRGLTPGSATPRP